MILRYTEKFFIKQLYANELLNYINNDFNSIEWSTIGLYYPSSPCLSYTLSQR